MKQVDKFSISEQIEIVTYKSDRFGTGKDVLDFIVKIVGDPNFTVKQIKVKDGGDRDCWDRYEQLFCDKDSFSAEYERLARLCEKDYPERLSVVSIVGTYNGTPFTPTIRVDDKLVRVSTEDKFNYIALFETLGY